MHQDSSDIDDQENIGHDASDEITSNDVFGVYHKHFPCSEDHQGVKLDIYTIQAVFESRYIGNYAGRDQHI